MTDDRPADLVLTGGRIATMDAARSWASALAVRDGRIVAVGPDAAVRDLIGASTRARSGSAVGRSRPAFQDAHVHLRPRSGLALMRCDLNVSLVAGDYLEIIAAHYAAASHPHGKTCGSAGAGGTWRRSRAVRARRAGARPRRP